MNDTLLSCDAFDALLPDYLEGTLDATQQAAVERHAHECSRCGALLGDLLAITAQARSLPDLVPGRDLWDGIAARIEAPVVTLPAHRAGVPLWRRRAGAWIGAAAAALVVATAGITYMATRAFDRGAASPVATTTPAAHQATIPSASTAAPAPAGPSRLASSGGAPATRRQRPEQVYDREIGALAAILQQRRSQLDTSTVRVIEHNLAIIDAAIAQSRAALAKDPASGFLNDQLNSALDQKVELLRTVALLPAHT
jgi:hypothetical protein